MKQDLVKVQLHGILGESIGNLWKVNVKTIGNALNAIDVLSKRKFYKFLKENDDKGIKYAVLINGREFIHDKKNPPNIEDLDSIKNTELCAKINKLETIDIVPVIQGSGKGLADIFSVILGAVLVVVGIILAPAGIGVALIIGGLGLIAAGVINLLSQGPELQEFKDRQKSSFLFSGPVNTINEGGPVPIGYGELIIGSSVISASYDVAHFDAGDNLRIAQS